MYLRTFSVCAVGLTSKRLKQNTLEPGGFVLERNNTVLCVEK